MRILFLTDNFPPETNAPATRTYEHSRRWVARKHQVTVITGAPNFPSGKVFGGYENKLLQRETMDGIDVIRVPTYITANEGFLLRMLDYMSFMVSAFIAGLFLPKHDVIVTTSPQFFTSCAGFVLSKCKRRPFVFELRDLGPDAIVAVGAMRESLPIRLLKRLEYMLYRKAACIVSVTKSYKSILTANGIMSEKIVVIHNGVDLAAFQDGDRLRHLEAKHGLQGKFVAAYVGTLGLAHGLKTLLDAADRLRDRSDIVLLLIGTGAEESALRDLAAHRKLKNVVFVGAVDKATVKDYWRLTDVALVLLRDLPLFRHVLPSKMFEAMGMARPIILGVQGESAELLAASGAGIAVRPEDATALAEAVRTLADNHLQCRAMGLAGRRYVEHNFDRNVLADEMLKTLLSIQGSERRAARPLPLPRRHPGAKSYMGGR
jgi:glycosyltransferase involved in cell wall biosynthesis